MKNLTYSLLLIIYLGLTNVVLALDELTDPRQVTGIACHVYDGECAVALSGESFGVQHQCASTQARWDSFDPNGKAMLALLTSAQNTGKNVRLNIHDCFPNIAPGRPNVPTFNFVIIGCGVIDEC